MIEKLKTLKTILGDLILTGSLALAYHGLAEFEKCKDLDLIMINPTASAKEILGRMQAENPAPKFKEGGPVNYSFIFENIQVDVWIISKHEDKAHLVTSDNVKVASVRSIVNAKMSYGRSKDWIQLMQMAKRIYDPAKFEAALPTLANHSEDYNG